VLGLAVVALAGCTNGDAPARGTTSAGSSGGGTGGAAGGTVAAATCGGTAYAESKSRVAQKDPSSVAPAALAAAVTANNAFALDLYAHVLEDPAISPNTNVITSPISASIALTMTYAGAKGQTASQMASALHFGTTPSIFDGQNALLGALAGRAAEALAVDTLDTLPSDYQVQIVNAVWGEKAYAWESSFLDVLAQSYGTGVYLADFYSDADMARQSINAWVSCETDSKIQDLLPQGALDCSTRMVLVNAIHLKLPWELPFDPKADTMMTFTTGAGTTVMAPFMQSGDLDADGYPYVDDGQAQIVALPLGGSPDLPATLAGAQLAVLVALPDGDLATYESALAAGTATLHAPSPGNAHGVALPKLTFTSATVSLRRSLEQMGMLEAFGDKSAYGDQLGSADFTGLVANPDPPGQPCNGVLEISDVLQKATIGLTETGVEAAAATAVLIGGSFDPSLPPPLLVVNRPFVVAIVDVPTGAILFLGHVEDPTDSGGS
jgi:serpin B